MNEQENLTNTTPEFQEQLKKIWREYKIENGKLVIKKK